MQKLEELIAALERAEGPDRWLDAKVAAALEPHRFDASPFSNIRPIPNFRLGKSEGVIRFEGGGLMDMRFFPAVTASIDAAVALVDRVLPEVKLEITTTGFKPGCTVVMGGTVTGGAYAATPALAITIATLRAKLSQENTNVKN